MPKKRGIDGLSTEINMIIGAQFEPPAAYGVLIAILTPGTASYDETLVKHPERRQLIEDGIARLLELHPDAAKQHAAFMTELSNISKSK